MPKQSDNQLKDALRQVYMDKVMKFLEDSGEEILRTKSNEFAFPAVDSAGNDRYVQVIIRVPSGSTLDGTSFDGYEAAENYKIELEEKAKKAEAARLKKEKAAAERQAKKAARAAQK